MLVSEDKLAAPNSWLEEEHYASAFAKAAIARFDAAQKRLRKSKRHDRIQRAWQMLYARDKDGSCDNTHINRKGAQGEILTCNVNRFARILRDQQTDIRNSPPNFEPEAINSSAKAQDAAKLARGILEWYSKELHLNEHRVHRVELLQIATEAVQHLRWDPLEGREIAVEDVEEPDPEGDERTEDEKAEKRRVVYEGDFACSVRSLYDYAIDPTSPDPRRPRWSIVREPMDRYDAIRNFVDAEPADDAEAKRDKEGRRRAILAAEPWSKRLCDWKYEDDEVDFDDSIAVFYVYGERSSSCPEGRQAIVLDEKTCLVDGPMTEVHAGVFLQRARDVLFRTNEATADAFDGLPISEAHGAMVTTMLSNVDAFGLQRMLSANESNVDVNMLQNGLANITFQAYMPGSQQPIPPPSMLAATPMSPDVFSLEALLSQSLDMVLGGSAVRRGDPEATKGDSGSKAALLYSASQTASSPLVTSTLAVDAEIATWMIASLSQHVTTERLTTIVGEKNASIAREFVGTDLNEVRKVTVKPANAARDTFEGRMALSELLAGKPPEERDMILALVNTGQVESVTEPDESERMLIERENADLLDAKKDAPIVNSWDMHQQHVHYHKAGFADPDLRRDPERLKRLMQHCAEHVGALSPGSPNFAGFDVLTLTGQQPLLPPPMPDPEGDERTEGQSPGAAPPAQAGPPGKPSSMPDMPRQPVNPIDGERVSLPVPSAPQVA